MKVLVVGSGAREHAICWKLKQSPLLRELYICPGNPGTAELGTNVELDIKNLGVLALWAVEHRIDLTVVGPDDPLSEGIVDIFEKHGLKIFGPTREAARLEWSKSYAKEVMNEAGVPTAQGAWFDNYDQALDFINKAGAPIVIKADGLALGKGVVVAETIEQARSTLEEFMLKERFGAASQCVVLEEKLVGGEASVMAIVDGETVLPLAVSQDHKRLLDENKGPNTGGMGAISPTPVLQEHRIEQLIGDIFIPVVKELAERGIYYRGFLYAGVMVEPSGAVKVLEFNCRLGDPEAQAVLVRMQSDLLEVLVAAVNRRLDTVELAWKNQASACVVMASEGYPGDIKTGREIKGLFPAEEDLIVFQAGTQLDENNQLLTKGGRVLSVTALGATLPAALRHAYSGVKRIHFDGAHYRTDIGGGAW